MNNFAQGHALIIGISAYPQVNPLPDIVTKDAHDLKKILTNPHQCGYPAEQVELLLDGYASSGNIRIHMQALAQRTTPDDTLIIFFSGHGWRTPDGKQNYLITYDSCPDDEGRLVIETAIESKELTSLLRKIQAGRLVVLFDCCHAGGAGETKDIFEASLPGLKAGLAESYYDQLKQGQGRVIMASCREDELSWILPGMENSLFTHHLLKALRGQVVGADGVISVFDLFRYVSKAVPGQHPNQHPIFKSHLENDFAIALHPLSGRHHPSKREPSIVEQKIAQIEDLEDLLPEPRVQAKAILGEMFAEYNRVIVETLLSGGFSGSYVLKIKPDKTGSTAKSVVVKIASVGQTEQEQRGYRLIRDYWSQLMHVGEQLAVSPDGRWAGITYQMAGGDLFNISTLLDFILTHDIDQISAIFKDQLIPLLQQAYENTLDINREVYWYLSYTHFLPKNLVITEAAVPSTEQPILIDANNPPRESPKATQYVQLSDFEVEKINPALNRVSLILRTKNPFQTYTVWVDGVSTLDNYIEGEVLPTLTGCVVKNRENWLHTEASRAFGATIDFDDPNLVITNEIELPNPLQQLDQILKTRRSMRTAYVHGDLNLANILVTETGQIQFIDFAAARKDHILHDYFHLETGIMTKVVPQLLYRSKRPQHPIQIAEAVYKFYGQLHHSIIHSDQTKTEPPYPELIKPFEILRLVRQSAQWFLSKRDDWTEYFHGLTIYLLGALRFADLEEVEGVMTQLPKQVAFIGAATLLSILQESVVDTDNGNKRKEDDWLIIQIKLKDPEYKRVFVELLLECQTISNPLDRQTVISNLPININNTIHRSSNNRVDTTNIVNRALDFEGGIEKLIESVRAFEGDALPMQKVDEFLRSLIS